MNNIIKLFRLLKEAYSEHKIFKKINSIAFGFFKLMFLILLITILICAIFIIIVHTIAQIS